MSDTVLFMTGLSVFGMMMVAIIMTIVEFREMNEKQRRKNNSPD